MMIDWEDYAAERIAKKKALIEKEKAKEHPDELRIRMLEADIWMLENSCGMIRDIRPAIII